ncbi:maltose ABC transporter permease MalF [Caldimonas sp. KR1-144]|uniref:maltose ABC transporter permease MalF n=1 Tax=Caldimonas sp. KR1-144 TaxID=3400911 RepID=UPI003BFB85A5
MATTTKPSAPARERSHPLKWPLALLAALACLWLVFRIYASGQPVWAVGALGLCALGFFVYLSNIAFAYRYLFPGLAGMAVFVAFPLLYTVQIGFTNYSSSNLLSFERASAYLLEQSAPGEGQPFGFTLHAEGSEFRLVLAPKHDEEDEDDPARRAELLARTFVSPPLALIKPRPPLEVAVLPLKDASFQPNEPLGLAEVLKHRQELAQLRVRLPDGTLLSYAGVREFAALEPTWKRNADGSLTQVKTGHVARANHETGFYEFVDGPEAGSRIQPGFKVGIGFGNYARMFNDPDFRGPFVAIFLWTVAFAALTVVFTLIVGVTLAVLLNWEALRFRTVYRTLLFLPYAVPGFISILVFKGLFNQNFGEINVILNSLFGLKPAWFADPTLAKVMILIVNTWLGYPYIMVLCTGLIKAIPSDLYEASAIAGAGPLTNFFRITAPLIVKPLTPLLIASFAFNFNNFVLIALLTNGRPDFLNTKVPAGTTDILVSYTYRIAFQDSGQNFGLAAAISTVIFFLVALLSMANLKLAKVNNDRG